MPAGKYIVIEGGDGTGKTTQANLLQQHLESQGLNVIHLKEPGGSPVAEAIRSVIVDGTLDRTPMTNILLFTANRHELWHTRIKPELEKGTWVICTRNYWSTLAYQGYGEGMSESIITAITATFTEQAYMNPDVGIILTLDDVETSKSRISERGVLNKPDTFESRDDSFQQRVNEGYRAIADTYHLPIISASNPIDIVAAAITEIVDAKSA
jgi:dTMP kinase